MQAARRRVVDFLIRIEEPALVVLALLSWGLLVLAFSRAPFLP